MEESTASFLDKTDWRLTLHRKLEECVNSEGTLLYCNRVKSLVSAASATYPGWDAKVEIETEIERLQNYYNREWQVWLTQNSTAKKHRKYKHMKQLYNDAHKDIFEFIKNMCARKRMLLWGSKKVPGGTQMEDAEE